LESKLHGNAHKYGKNVDTDVIIPGRYLTITDPKELAKHCLEGIDPGFVTKMQAGDFILADSNFGCGSSREHAPMAIKAAGVQAVVARSFARIFYRNAINIGLPVIQCDAIYDAVGDGDPVSIDIRSGAIGVDGKMFKGETPGPVAVAIMEAGTLVDLIKTRGWAAIEEVS